MNQWASVARRGRCVRTVLRAAWPSPRFWSVLGALALALAPGATVAADALRIQSLEETYLNVGVSLHAFSQVNENDAKAALRVFSAELGKKYGYHLRVEVSLFDNLPAFAQAIRAGNVTQITVNPWELFAMGIEDAVDIKFSAVSSGTIAHRWLLLVRRDSGVKSAADLKGRNALVLQNEAATLGMPWIETVLLEQGLGTPTQFFGTCQTVNKASAAVLPVFFGKVEACIVDQAAFAVMGEMNPQVGQMLVPVAQSEPLMLGIVCLNRIGWPSAKVRDVMVRGLTELDRDPAGRQLLTLFKCDRLAPFEPAQLESVKRLYARHHQLQNTPKP